MGTLLGLLLLGLIGALGVAGLWRFLPVLTPLERIAYGVPLGMVVTSLAYLLIAALYGPGRMMVLLTGALCLIALLALIVPKRHALAVGRLLPRGAATSGFVASPSPFLPRFSLPTISRLPVMEILILGGISLWFIYWWSNAVVWDNGGVGAVLPIWSDWKLHLGNVSSFVYGNNIPAEDPTFAGQPFAYHYLPSITAAMMAELGTPPINALVIHSCLLSIFVTLVVYAFARRLSSRRTVAIVTVLLVTFGGGLEWLLVAQRVDEANTLMQIVRERPLDSAAAATDANFHWQNIYTRQIMPQRGYLYGIPLTLLTLTLLYLGIRRRRPDWFFLAGIVAGLLPFAHQSPLPVLGLVVLGLIVQFPSRYWLIFFGAWVGLTVPQLAVQEGTGNIAESLRWQVGWFAGSDPWLWFWIKQLGWFLPLLILALLTRGLIPALAWRFLWTFMPVFIIANLILFSPNPWDNSKLITFWYLASAIFVAALVAHTWRTVRLPVIRFLLVMIVGSIMLGGILEQFQAIQEPYDWLSAEEVALGEEIRATTPPDAVFATGFQTGNPIMMISGRQVVMGYRGWLSSRGIDSASTEQDLRQIYRLTPAAPALIEAHDISFVVIDPWVRDNFEINEAGFRTQYPVLTETENYVVFDVR